MKLVRIFLAEDNRGDILLIRQALAQHQIEYELFVARDGEAALDFLTRMGNPGEEPCPDVMLLDLNLPKVDGAQVLRVFRQHPQCERTPVIVISSSDAPKELAQVTAIGISRYFRKPLDLDGFMQLGALVRQLVE
jgi:CheY-like chemotaxis protein